MKFRIQMAAEIRWQNEFAEISFSGVTSKDSSTRLIEVFADIDSRPDSNEKRSFNKMMHTMAPRCWESKVMKACSALSNLYPNESLSDSLQRPSFPRILWDCIC